MLGGGAGRTQSPSAFATPSASATSAAAASPEKLPPLQAQLPGQLGGVELHTFAVGQDTLDRLAAARGVPRTDVEAAYASEHGARFFQMYAIAYPPDVTDVSVTEETIDGRAVTVVHAPSAAGRLGTFYVLPRDGTLFVVQALDRETAEEALAGLP